MGIIIIKIYFILFQNLQNIGPSSKQHFNWKKKLINHMFQKNINTQKNTKQYNAYSSSLAKIPHTYKKKLKNLITIYNNLKYTYYTKIK